MGKEMAQHLRGDQSNYFCAALSVTHRVELLDCLLHRFVLTYLNLDNSSNSQSINKRNCWHEFHTDRGVFRIIGKVFVGE